MTGQAGRSPVAWPREGPKPQADMVRPDRSQPMPVKYWSRAGLMLTDWCNAACASCYANCSDRGRRWMGVDEAVDVWHGLAKASPHGCRIHLTGGEAFGRFEHLLAVCRRGRQRGLQPAPDVETNGFWAIDEQIVLDRLTALDAAGLGRLTISTDPYHQQFVPIDRPRRLACLAGRALGPERVRVRWADWLGEGSNTDAMTPAQREDLFARYAASRRDRFTGRAFSGLDGKLVLKPAEALDDNPCRERLLRGGGVHIWPGGQIWPATCIGIVVGNAMRHPIAQTWEALRAGWEDLPIVAPLSRRGPVALLGSARQSGFLPRRQGYASKCQLCYDVRRHLLNRPDMADHLGPPEVYGLTDVGQSS